MTCTSYPQRTEVTSVSVLKTVFDLQVPVSEGQRFWLQIRGGGTNGATGLTRKGFVLGLLDPHPTRGHQLIALEKLLKSSRRQPSEKRWTWGPSPSHLTSLLLTTHPRGQGADPSPVAATGSIPSSWSEAQKGILCCPMMTGQFPSLLYGFWGSGARKTSKLGLFFVYKLHPNSSKLTVISAGSTSGSDSLSMQLD